MNENTYSNQMALVDATVPMTDKTDIRKKIKMLTSYQLREQAISRCYTPNRGMPNFIKQILLDENYRSTLTW